MFFFFFNDTATTEIYTLSLHDALPIWPQPLDLRLADVKEPRAVGREQPLVQARPVVVAVELVARERDRKSTRLNSSHDQISYAVFCLKKKKTTNRIRTT